MANRLYQQFQYTAERSPVTLYSTVTIGAAGAVASGGVKGYGISSVAKQATAGQYQVVLQDKFTRALSVQVQVVHSSISAVKSVQVLMTPAQLQSALAAGTAITIQCLDAAGAAVNPESGAQLFLQVVATNSSVDLGKGV